MLYIYTSTGHLGFAAVKALVTLPIRITMCRLRAQLHTYTYVIKTNSSKILETYMLWLWA